MPKKRLSKKNFVSANILISDGDSTPNSMHGRPDVRFNVNDIKNVVGIEEAKETDENTPLARIRSKNLGERKMLTNKINSMPQS